MEVSTLPRRGGGSLPHPRQVLKAFGDDRLVEQIRRGNEAAFEVVYERHHRGILSFCRHMLSSQEEAEDAVQQTFVSAYYDLRSSDKEIRLKPWLYTIARNRCLSVLRARREQPAEIDDIPTTGLTEAVQQRDDLRRMLADMHGLPTEQRAALVLSELGDLSHADIGAILGCPAVKVKSLVFQARSSLIESRDAREIPCAEIREQLATLRGGSLRRGPLRKHLNACPGCREFREEVRRQRAALAALLPVIPSSGLKTGIMGAIGGGGAAGGGAAGLGAATTAVAGGGAAAGGSAGIGGVVAMLAGGGTAKLAVAAIIATGAAGGTVAIVSGTDSDEPAAREATQAKPARDAAGGVSASKSPDARRAAPTKERKAKKSKDMPTLVMGPDGTITVLPNGSAGGGNGRGDGGNSAYAPGRTQGNSNGPNGTRTRAHGNPPAKGGRGRGATPAPQAAPEVAPPTTTPPAAGGNRGGNGGGKSHRGVGGKGPRLPDVLPLP
ncbi:MAG TPA: RNA polymerase sigma factor [Thermoleophilaceae bacterium]|jgi:RNA polymerase sigma factor (sigma-70 family)